jgi:hypothetical protein
MGKLLGSAGDLGQRDETGVEGEQDHHRQLQEDDRYEYRSSRLTL